MKNNRAKLLAIICFLVAMLFLSMAAAHGTPLNVVQTEQSPDGRWTVELSDYAHPTDIELRSRPNPPGLWRKLGKALAHDFDVAKFVISANSERVAYSEGRTATGQWAIFATNIHPPGPFGFSSVIQISPPSGRAESNISLALNGTAVRFRWAAIPGSDGFYYVGDFSGAWLMQELFVDGFESGGVTKWN